VTHNPNDTYHWETARAALGVERGTP
jgi:hypothetical protein